jgi:predicted secreted Zn-dependent protease
MAQKLSSRALMAKRKRDLAAANSPRRKKMRAENQRKRREAIKNGKNIKGMDYDHTKKRFVSVKANRGGHGKGTKR